MHSSNMETPLCPLDFARRWSAATGQTSRGNKKAA
jgi:hypothetical protein